MDCENWILKILNVNVKYCDNCFFAILLSIIAIILILQIYKTVTSQFYKFLQEDDQIQDIVIK